MKKGIIPIAILILLICFIFAAPSIPEGFNGNIVVKDGSNPNGKLLVGYVNGIATGQAVITTGKFDIIVTDNIGKGGKVEFYIGTQKAAETFTFDSLNVITTDLTFKTISGNSSCGDDICEIGECSTCAIDCSINDCSNNSRCDIEIGENCANAPADCGVCLYCGDGICNNGETCSTCPSDCGGCSSPSSGGGSSGGGGGSYSPLSTPVTNNTNNTGELSNLDINKLNEENTQSSTPGITGSVIEFVKSGTGIGVIVILILVLIIGVIAIKKKRTPLRWKKD